MRFRLGTFTNLSLPTLSLKDPQIGNDKIYPESGSLEQVTWALATQR